MASRSLTTIPSNFQQFHSPTVSSSSCYCPKRSIKFEYNPKFLSHSVVSNVRKPISTFASGLEASIDDSAIALKDAKIVVESKVENKIQLRVDVTGIETQKVFNKVLTNLARQAPPIPGFRRQKGGKTTNVPKEFLLQMLGEERVTKFVIQEIVTSTVADHVKKENWTVKDSKVTTSQTPEELKVSFRPGNEFGFNAILEIEESETSD